jgi:p-cumate 2,3-dioxygenase subunit alpha
LYAKELVRDSPEQGTFRVHRSTMTEQRILDAEWDRIFQRSWLYVGHESELPEPGDYRRRNVARRPLIFLRNREGEVKIFFNTCTHRGALVCRKDAGNANNFQCFYHAWTFNTDGELMGVPGKDAYAEEVDLSELALGAPARVESFKGLYFISFADDIEDLETWLGPLGELMGYTLDAGEVLGGWQVMDGTSNFEIKANWKLLVENSIDSYHFATVHQTYGSYVAKRRAAAGGTKRKEPTGPTSRGLAFPNGHAGFLHESDGRPIAAPNPMWSESANSEIQQVRERLFERFGSEIAPQMADWSRHLLVFPNLMFQDSSTGFRIRQIWPLAPDRMQVLQWELVPREESDELRASRLDSSATFLGPGGFGSPDDVEALESCQHGFAAIESPWSDISRGIRRDEPRADDELQMRGFWREWAARMQEADILDPAQL